MQHRIVATVAKIGMVVMSADFRQYLPAAFAFGALGDLDDNSFQYTLTSQSKNISRCGIVPQRKPRTYKNLFGVNIL